MSAATASTPAPRGRFPLSRATLLSTAGLLVVGLVVAQQTGAHHFQALPYVGRGLVAVGPAVRVTGAAAAARLTPEPLRPIWPLLSLPAGAVLGSLGLTALGFAAVPLHVSLWLVLAAGRGRLVALRARAGRRRSTGARCCRGWWRPAWCS